MALLGAGATAVVATLWVTLHANGVRLPEASMAVLIAQGTGFVSLALYAGAFQLRSPRHSAISIAASDAACAVHVSRPVSAAAC